MLKEGDRAEVLGSHVDQLLLSMSMQIKMVYSTHMSSDFTSKDDVTRLYRCLLGTLLAVSILIVVTSLSAINFYTTANICCRNILLFCHWQSVDIMVSVG